MKVLTISVASYNCETTLEKCLESMVNSKHINELEIIIVNDGSRDNTLNIANKYAHKFPQSVIVIDKENGGHGSTINESITKASGKYFKIVDSDDWVETNNLDRLVEMLASSEEDVIINSYFEVDCVDCSKKLIPAIKNGFPINQLLCIDTLKNTMTSMFMHKLTFKTSVVKNVGPIIDEHCFYVDTEYVAFSFSYVKTIRVLDYPVYDYLIGNDSQSVSLINRIKRKDQHYKVCLRLFKFAEEIKENETRNYTLICEYLSMVTRNMYMIYLAMPNNEGKKEFLIFDSIVPDIVFDNLGDKIRCFVKFMRKTNFRLYATVVPVFKRIGLIE